MSFQTLAIPHWRLEGQAFRDGSDGPAPVWLVVFQALGVRGEPSTRRVGMAIQGLKLAALMEQDSKAEGVALRKKAVCGGRCCCGVLLF